MKLSLFFTFLIFITSLASAQKFKPGYMVRLKGDTIRGFFANAGSKSIKFKPAENAPAVSLTPADIWFVDINGRDGYQRYIGPITLDWILESAVRNGRDSASRQDTVFLKVLNRGKILTLYSYSDHIKTRFYFTEKNTDMPVELGYRVYYNIDRVDIIAQHGRTVNENTYMKQLYDLAFKNNLLTDKFQWLLEDSRYDESYILNLARTLNNAKLK